MIKLNQNNTVYNLTIINQYRKYIIIIYVVHNNKINILLRTTLRYHYMNSETVFNRLFIDPLKVRT